MLARKLRTKQTDAEQLLWSKLRGSAIPGFKFRRQFPIKPYFADFCCEQSRLVIELDGGQHSQMGDEDRNRTKYIEKHGCRVIRFWDNDVLVNTNAIMEAIYNELQLPSSCGLAFVPTVLMPGRRSWLRHSPPSLSRCTLSGPSLTGRVEGLAGEGVGGVGMTAGRIKS